MEPNGIFLNRNFQVLTSEPAEEKRFAQHKSPKSYFLSGSKATFAPSEKDYATSRVSTSTAEATMTRSTSSSFLHSCSKRQGTRTSKGGALAKTNENFRFCLRSSSNNRPLAATEKEGVRIGNDVLDICDDYNNNECRNSKNYSISSTLSCSSSSSTSFVDSFTTKKIKSKSGVRKADNLHNTSHNWNKDDDEVAYEDGEEQELFTLPKTTANPTLPNLSSPMTWKLPNFLCLPFTNNDANNSYLHLVKTSSKSSGILSLTSLMLVVMALVLASVPVPVMSAAATETGDPVLFTEDVSNNDVTPHDYLTTPSILPVRLQTITFTSHEGPTSEDLAQFSSSATGRTTGGGTGPSVTHHSIDGLRQEPSMNDFAGWRDADSLTAHSAEVESSSDKAVHHDDSPSPHKEYEFKSGFPEMKNETREALQEEGSNHQPVVFVGGSGYVPPNSLRPRPSLDADPLWQDRPLAETRYPLPSAWDRNYRNPFNMTRVQHIEAECQDDFMKIRVAFNGSFHGLIYSSGYSYDPDCVYVNGTGRDYYEYLIKLNRCGTLGSSNHVEGRREPSKNFMWNTVTVQYNPMIEEEFDEHFKVTCEYGYDFWKTVTFPFLDVEVATGNPVVFTLTPPECYMEVRYGFGTTGTRVGGPVRVGDPLTLMINMRSQYDGFDIVVNDCYAHNGATKRIQLIDHYGCPVDSKLMSPFRGMWSHTNMYETQVYAYLKTFRFTGSPALYIECDVRMCHGQCPAQPCYWRNVKSVSKRSTDSQVMIADNPERNSTLSENLSLFHALRVLQEDEDSEAQRTNLDTHESVCMKTGAFTAMISLSTLILVVLTVSTMIMCFRLRRVKVIEERESAADILRPYSHHVSPSQSQHSHNHQRHHHWSSAKPR